MTDDDPILIEHDVPITRSHGCSIKWPFYDLKVGDSFFVRANGDGRAKLQRRLAVRGVKYTKTLGWTFSTRCVEGGVRVWRMT